MNQSPEVSYFLDNDVGDMKARVHNKAQQLRNINSEWGIQKFGLADQSSLHCGKV
jgi:hypothetical protein